MNPAMIAVINPFSGDTPEEIPNAMDRGSAIIATIIPAIKSFKNCSFENPLYLSSKREINFGLYIEIYQLLIKQSISIILLKWYIYNFVERFETLLIKEELFCSQKVYINYIKGNLCYRRIGKDKI